jgi:hypothetical protein
MNAMTPETPVRIEDHLVRVPDGQDVPQEPAPAPRPWYRRRRSVLITIAAVAALLGGLAAGLLTTVFASSGPADPASILKADGYSLFMTATPAQMAAMGGPSAASATPYITNVVIGTKGQKVEIVCGLTDAGRILDNANLGHFGGDILQLGGTWYMKSGQLVDDTSMSALNNLGNNSQAS